MESHRCLIRTEVFDKGTQRCLIRTNGNPKVFDKDGGEAFDLEEWSNICVYSIKSRRMRSNGTPKGFDKDGSSHFTRREDSFSRDRTRVVYHRVYFSIRRETRHN